MLRFPLTHPALLEALASGGHGSRVLIADGNYAHRTNTRPGVPIVYLNLRPGLLTGDQVLEAVAEAVPIEAAAVMAPDDGSRSEAAQGYRAMLGDVPFTALAREDFYAACKAPELVVAVATGDMRYFANVLLTIGALPPAGSEAKA